MESANNYAKKCFFVSKICIIENKVVSLHAFFAEALSRCHMTPRGVPDTNQAVGCLWWGRAEARVAEREGPFVYRLGREIFIL